MNALLPPENPPAWIGLAGPTASGKTALALELARRIPLEIVSVDSALVYRGMDIGTAKPSPAERARVPHHLLDLIDPTESYSAARFVLDAQACIADIQGRGRLPLLVGGTMLYFKALMDGMDAMPGASPTLRAQLDAEGAALGWPAMHARLAEVDPVTAARLAPQDSQRIQRALEVFHLTGLPLSHFHRRSEGRSSELPHHRATEAAEAGPLLISLEPEDRGWLHHRIHLRMQAMLDDGFVNEVEALRRRGDLHPELPAMRCVGYRQAWEALDQGIAGPALNAQILERGSAATRQLAKRQITWLRSMHRWALPAERPDIEAIVQRIAQGGKVPTAP